MIRYFILNLILVLFQICFITLNNVLDNSSEDVIQPNEFILKKGETITVEVTIVMSPERLEMLIEQDSSAKIININKISLIYGDEVSRVRVSRSVFKYIYYKMYFYII